MKKVKKFIVAMSVGMLLFTNQGVMVHAESTSNVDPILAKKAAASVIINAVQSGESTVWSKNTKVGVVQDVYDPTGNKVAYVVEFIDDGKKEGYALISAFLDEEPILMWSENGQYVNEEKAESVAIQELSKKQSILPNDVSEVSSEIVWYGGAKLGVEVNSDKGDTILVDDNMKTFALTNDEQLEKYPIPSANEINRDKWKALEDIKFGSPGETNPSNGATNIDPATWEPTYNRIEKFYINGVTSQKQWNYASGQATGCSPTAASNIVMWFAKQYPSLNPTGNQRDIVMALRGTMNTTQNGNGVGITAPSDINNGIQTYFRNHGVPSAGSKNSNLASFDEYKSRISQGTPVLQSYWNQGYFGDHTVTVVGYKEFVRGTPTTSSKYLVVKNNWSSDNFDLYVKWGTWNTNVMTYTYVSG